MNLFTTPPTSAAGSDVRAALREASARTGVTFDYLLSTAQRESGLDADAQAPTSSARGLFQFIESTWLTVLRESGAELGYAAEAARIETDAKGRSVVSDPAVKREILALRDDPEAASMMAAALTVSNAEAIERAVGRAPTAGDLYAAHFLGAGGAIDLITLSQQAPDSVAAEAFPAAARANRAIFYERDGTARSVSQVHAELTRLHGGGEMEVTPAQAPASRPTGLFAYAGSSTAPFHSLFSERGLGPIGGTVNQLFQKAEPPAEVVIDAPQVAVPPASAVAEEVPLPPPARSGAVTSPEWPIRVRSYK